MTTLENGLKRKKILYILLWEDFRDLEGELKWNKELISGKSVVTLEWLI